MKSAQSTNTFLLGRRLDAGLNQTQLAHLIGVGRKVYARAEAGGEPQARHAARFSAYYGVSSLVLFHPELVNHD